MTSTEPTPAVPSGSAHPRLRTPLAWGAVLGVAQAASPLAFPPLPPATVYALGLTFIAAVYIGFAVADGRRQVPVRMQGRSAMVQRGHRVLLERWRATY